MHRAAPAPIQVDNGSAYISRVLDKWPKTNVSSEISSPCKPTDNPFIEPFIERFNASFLDTREKADAWRHEYNDERPHSSLGDCRPREYEQDTCRPTMPNCYR